MVAFDLEPACSGQEKKEPGHSPGLTATDPAEGWGGARGDKCNEGVRRWLTTLTALQKPCRSAATGLFYAQVIEYTDEFPFARQRAEFFKRPEA
jgi:hypothetical protein